MIKSWVYYIVWLLFVFILNVFSNSTGAIILFAFSVLIPLVMILVHLFISPDIDIKVEFPKSSEKGEALCGTVYIINNKWLPYTNVSVTITGENQLTGEVFSFPVKISVSSFGEFEYPIKIEDKYCGKIKFSASEFKVYDTFCLIYKRKTVDIHGSALILPNLFSSEVTVTCGNGSDTDNVEYSTVKPGFDISEPFDYREYVPGDSPKSIHWKLTEKLDKVVIRQGGLPIPKSVILLFETGVRKQEELPSYMLCDAMAEAFIAVSRSLSKNGNEHMIAWQDQKSHEFIRYTINSENDLIAILPKLLSASIAVDEVSCKEHYIENYNSVKGMHIVCVSSVIANYKVLDETQITILLACEDDIDISGDTNGIRVIPFAAESIDTDLFSVNI